MAESQGCILTFYVGTDRVFSKAIKATLEKREGLSVAALWGTGLDQGRGRRKELRSYSWNTQVFLNEPSEVFYEVSGL